VNRKQRPSIGATKLTLLLLLALAGAAQGQTVYKSVDANGNIVYSDTPPDETLLLETFTLSQPSKAESDAQQRSDDQIERMAGVTERLKEDREARERQRREEEERARAQQQQATPPLIYREEYYRGYYPYREPYGHYYPPYRGRYPYRPDHRRHHDREPQWDRSHDYNNDAILVPRSKLLTPGRDK